TTEPGNAALSIITSYSRNGFGNLTGTTQSWQDPITSTQVSRTTTTAYDTNGRYPVTVNSPCTTVCQSESRTYDDTTGQQTGVTGPNGLTTTWMLDGFGRKQKEARA